MSMFHVKDIREELDKYIFNIHGVEYAHTVRYTYGDYEWKNIVLHKYWTAGIVLLRRMGMFK